MTARRRGGPATADVDRERFERHLSRSEFYRYDGPPEDVELVNRERRGALDVTDFRFMSVLPSGNAVNDVVTCRLFAPRGAPDTSRPVVFLHGLGLSRLSMWDSFVAALARKGLPTLMVNLPYTCERRPPGMRRGFSYTSTDSDVALPAYEQAVADVRSSLDLLLSGSYELPVWTGQEVEPAIVGVSLGSFIGVIAAALDRRFRNLVCVLGGADLEIVVFRGSYRMIVKRQLDQAGVRLENRRRARAVYRDYLERVRESEHPLDVPAPYHFFLFDPLTFASHLRSRPALLINAHLDPIIPRSSARQLWLEMGKPDARWYLGTHWAGGPWRPLVTGWIAGFLAGLEPGRNRTPKPSFAEPWAP